MKLWDTITGAAENLYQGVTHPFESNSVGLPNVLTLPFDPLGVFIETGGRPTPNNKPSVVQAPQGQKPYEYTAQDYQNLQNYHAANATNPYKQTATLTQGSNTNPYMSLSGDPNKNMWETGAGGLYDPKTGKVSKPSDMASLFSAPVPTGMIGFSAGEKYGSEKVRDLYGSQDAQGIWNRLKDESTQGLNAASNKAIADRFQGTQALERARISKAGLKGQAALRAQADTESQKRQEAAALSATMKKQAFESMRDEWGRRSLMALNYPIAYGQLGSSAMLGQTMQNLATQPLNTGAYS